MKHFLFLASLGSFIFASAQLKSPDEFLGYPLGSKFTRHHQVEDYYKYLLVNSENVLLQEYGKTYEDRPLMLATVSSKKNLDNLENIRQDNLRRAKLLEGTPSTDIGIVWLSYNVHGNESVSTEASMRTIYTLLTEKQEWLEDLVVIIDPCINPDGRERYVNFYWQYGNSPYNPDPNSLEHNEPWPRGRANHYLYDLNRDWAWQTQIETKQRMKVYNQWLPQIHVDFHEQGVNSPYYFAPAAEPYHELISPWQRQLQVDIGKNHAKYFDKNNWFYFTKQFFDLLYPSYGDTYPTYNGAIGMTYEQGGSGRAGLGVITQEEDTLTLTDRIDRHFTTGLSTVEVAYQQKAKMLSEFSSYFEKGVTNPRGRYKTFVLRGDNQEKLNDIKRWMDKMGIQYGTSTGAKIKGYNYKTKREVNYTVKGNDMVVSAYQPKSVLAQVLFEPKTYLSDSVTYDITAWAIPYAYGVQAYATNVKLNVNQQKVTETNVSTSSGKSYAFILEWKNLKDARLLSALLKEGIKTRFTERPITVNNKKFDQGSVIISKRDNTQIKDFETMIQELAKKHSRSLASISTGFVDNGPDIGSGNVRYLKAPKVAMLTGDGVSSLSFGAVWYYFEQEINYPVSVLNTSYFSNVSLKSYDVLVLPDGWYSSLEESDLKKINSWVRDGGKLILMAGAVGKFSDSDYSSIKGYNSDDEKEEFESREEEILEANKLVSYAQKERENIKGAVPGAIFKVTLDNTHPLAFGYDRDYYSLKTSNDRYGLLEEDWNVGYIRSKEDHLSGFAGQYVKEALENSLIFGVEERGRGEIVYMVDNPLFRSFWYNGKLLVANAIFFVGQ